MNAHERAQAIITDILTNHLPRIKEGLEKGYVDENQVLIVYDHLVRARVLQEFATVQPELEHQDNLAQINRELEKEWTAEMKPVIVGPEFSPVVTVPVEDNFNRPHSDQLQCACGGLVKELPTSVEALLKCERCERVYTDELEVFRVRKTETITPQKCPDSTYWTTGTLLGGTTPQVVETEINLNGRKTTITTKTGKFTLSYEQIVRMTLNQQRGHLNAFTGSDAELPMLSCTYSHRVQFSHLPGERTGSLYRGKLVECTPGMVISCIGTGNA